MSSPAVSASVRRPDAVDDVAHLLVGDHLRSVDRDRPGNPTPAVADGQPRDAVVDLLAHTIVVLHNGEIAETGPTAKVLGNPQDPYTKRLIASLPVPDPVEQAARRAVWDATRED